MKITTVIISLKFWLLNVWSKLICFTSYTEPLGSSGTCNTPYRAMETWTSWQASRPPSGPAVFSCIHSRPLSPQHYQSETARVCLSAVHSSAWTGRRWPSSLPGPPPEKTHGIEVKSRKTSTRRAILFYQSHENITLLNVKKQRSYTHLSIFFEEIVFIAV